MKIAIGLFCIPGIVLCGCSQRDRPLQELPANSVATEQPAQSPSDWSSYLGQTVTVDGTAENMKVGAYLVATGKGGIFIDGLHGWPDGYYSGGQGKRLRVTGTVIQKDDLPVFVVSPNGPVIQGMPVNSGEEAKKEKWRYLLKDAKWAVLE